jgi:hypothetical protein
MILTHLILFGFFPGAGGEIAPVVQSFPEPNSSKRIYKEAKKKHHSSIYAIQEKANRELFKLYEKTPEVLENTAPIEISIPAPKTKPTEVTVTVPVLLPPSTTFVLPPLPPLAIVQAEAPVITQTITLPDDMDDKEAIEAILALIQAGVV